MDPGPLVALDAEPVDPDAVNGAQRGVGVASQREHVDLVAGRHERLGLAADPRILVVVGVDDHRHGPAARHNGPRFARPAGRFVSAQVPLQPAPRRNTPRGRTVRPDELLTVSTTRSASR